MRFTSLLTSILVVFLIACNKSKNNLDKWLAFACIQTTACTQSGETTIPSPTAPYNVQSISVNGNPVPTVYNQYYPNAAFTSVTICPSGNTTNCATIGGILVDTGSYGLRVLDSAINCNTLSALEAKQETGSNGSGTLYNCAQFMDGSALWGWVASADVYIGGGEEAKSTPIQVVSSSCINPMPSACGSTNFNTVALLGANGILGVGTEPYDCGSDCASSQSTFYYNCNGTCSEDTAAESKQVANPIINFSTDNNGVILALPSVPGTATTLTGSMIFGIGTESNNALGSATILTGFSYPEYPDNVFITTTYNGKPSPYSFFDSGSNGLFFDDSSIPEDSDGWYCPSSMLSLSAKNTGANSNTSTVSFYVSNADTLLNSYDAALGNLAATMDGLNYSYAFDWGLPFFYGRLVYTSIHNMTQYSPATTYSNSSNNYTPYWAY